MGEKGAAYAHKKERIYQMGYPVKTVDTTGAGDTFTGYFLACILRNMQIKDCLQYASRAAAIAVTRKGAASAIPWKEEVDEYEEKIAL